MVKEYVPAGVPPPLGVGLGLGLGVGAGVGLGCIPAPPLQAAITRSTEARTGTAIQTGRRIGFFARIKIQPASITNKGASHKN